MKPVLPLFAGLLLLAGCSGGASNDQQAEPSALVKLATAETGDVASTLTVYGAVEANADTQYAVSAPVEATVARIVAPAGTPVSRGQVIVILSPSPATRADLTRVAAEARSAQQAYERAQRLRADGLVSDAEVESAHAAVIAANASSTAMASQSGQLTLRAPGTGFVQSIASRPGDLVAAGTPVAAISRSGDLRARFGVDPALLGQIVRGAGVQLTIPGTSSGPVLPIQAIDPSADPQSRLASVFVTVPASVGSGAGQPLRGTITLEQAGSAVTIPYAALQDDGGQPFVYVVTNDTAQRKDVTLGAADGSRVAITQGIQAGDTVVAEGGTALEDGMKVRTQ